VSVSPLVNGKRKTSDVLMDVLEDAGVSAAFGMIGGDAWMFFDALIDRRDSIRTIAVREESVAGVMAEVYGRLTGKPGLLVGQGAFLVSGALAGVLEAKLSNTPLLVLTDYSDGAPFRDHGAYQSGAAGYGEWDARKALEAVTKSTLSAADPVQAVQTTQFALKRIQAGAPGPVAVLLHHLALRGSVDEDAFPKLYSTGAYLSRSAPVADPAAVARLAEALAAAQRLVIIAGNGVRLAKAYSQLQQLAEALAAPVATTSGGKGVFPETHDLALGVVGTYGTPLANELVGQADTLLVLGSKLSPGDTANENPDLIDPARQTILQIDIDELNSSWTMPASQVVIGDLALVSDQLLETLAGPSDDVRAGRQANVAAARERLGWFDVANSAVDDVPMLPERVVKVLSDSLPEDAVVTADAGENRLFMLRHFQTKTAGSYLQPAGLGAMAHAVPAAMAARIVYPGRPVYAVCGDGGFAMSLQALITAYEEDLPIVVIVLNNSALGWVYHGQRRQIASVFRDFDYASVARSLNCVGYRAHSAAELQDALEKANGSVVPVVIDVVTNREGSGFLDIASPLSAPRRKTPKPA
jgi:acetolactate synthase-1/2/3 large subunit